MIFLLAGKTSGVEKIFQVFYLTFFREVSFKDTQFKPEVKIQNLSFAPFITQTAKDGFKSFLTALNKSGYAKEAKFYEQNVGVDGVDTKISKDEFDIAARSNWLNIKQTAAFLGISYATLLAMRKEDKADGIRRIPYIGEGKSSRYLGVYYISKSNFSLPKEIGKYSDLSFLKNDCLDKLLEKIDMINLSEEEKERKTKDFENQIEIKLKALNQKMHDDLKISVGSRVQLVAGLIMAALGVPNKVSPLDIADLKGNTGKNSNDGKTVVDKISDFLSEKKIPDEKKDLIVSDLTKVFIYSDLYKPMNGESKIKTIYTVIKNDIMPIFTSAKHLDFTGRLFNVLNEWVDKGLGFTPEVGLRYVHIKQDAYKDSADQKVSGNDSDILTGVIGAKVSKSWELSNGMNIKPEARIAATYDLFNDDVNSVVTLANGSAYAVEGEALDRFGMEFGAGVTAEVNDNVELSLGYEGKFREDYQDHTGLINAKYKF